MNIWKTYNKAKLVIASCDSQMQLKGAKRYINLWFDMYTTKDDNNKIIAEELVAGLYEKLKNYIYLKKYELKRESND